MQAYLVGRITPYEVVYSIPSINQTLLSQELQKGNFTLFPNAVSDCSIQENGQTLIRVSGFFSMSWGGPSINSTEYVLEDYGSFLTSSAGWPSEPACSS